MTRVEPWIIVDCPTCGVPAGTNCIGDVYMHPERKRDGYKLHRVWELAGAKPMIEEDDYPPVNT